MPKQLLIVFVKNIKLGKVKTRLAKTIGNDGAFEVYKELVKITEQVSQKVKVHRHIYFSDEIIDTKWKSDEKYVQKGNDLGEKMSYAFKKGFDAGYEQIILIGSDLPDITKPLIESGFEALQSNKTVFGQAIDGGYYLVGMSSYLPNVFINKPWSQPHLLSLTLQELKDKQISYKLLPKLNDIDTYEDLKSSTLSFKFNY